MLFRSAARAGATTPVHTGMNTAVFANALLAGMRSGQALSPATLLTALRAATVHLRQ